MENGYIKLTTLLEGSRHEVKYISLLHTVTRFGLLLLIRDFWTSKMPSYCRMNNRILNNKIINNNKITIFFWKRGVYELRNSTVVTT